MSRLLAVILTAAVVILTGGTAQAAPGDTSSLANRGDGVTGVEIDEDGDGTTDGIDIDGDGRWDAADTDGDGAVDDVQGIVRDAPTEQGCGVVDLVCKASEALNDAWKNLADNLVEAVGDTTVTLATFWLSTPPPDIGEMNSGGNGGTEFQEAPTVNFIQGSLQWLVSALAVLSLLLAAGRMAWERRTQPGKDVARSLLQLILVSGAGLAGMQVLLLFGQRFAEWIIGRATNNFGESLRTMLSLQEEDVTALAVMLTIVVAFAALVASIVQIILLVARNGFVVVLAGTWPLSAAATNTETGRAMFAKHTSWLLAFILYVPTAAIIYATGFQLVGNSTGATSPLLSALTGLTLVVLSIVALPALMRLVAPAVGAAVGGGGGGAGMAAAAAVPAGAAIARSSRGGGGGGSGGGGSSAGKRAGGAALGAAKGGGGAAAGGAAAGGAAAASGGTTAVLTRGAQIVQALGSKAAPPPRKDDDDKGASGGKR